VKYKSVILYILLCVFLANTQIDANSLFALPRVTTAEMNSVVTPTEGSLVYNSTTKSLFQYDGTTWIELTKNVARTIVLNRDGASLPTATDTYFDIPLSTPHILTSDPSTFTVIGDGRIRVLRTGVYIMTAELSVSNMPSGSRKYILGIFINGNGQPAGYLSRGTSTQSIVDWWGTTGVIMYPLNANDYVTFRYVVNAGTTLSGRLLNIGMSLL
jgi:hypothetical protein